METKREVEIKFPKLNHFWLDSGLLGLRVMLEETSASVDIDTSDYGITIRGDQEELRLALGNAYDLLIKRYYNLSTKKQQQDTATYNFYYDSQQDKFVAFPKKKSVGIAGVIYNKAPRPTCGEVKWHKKNKGVLPPSHAHLQEKMDEFLARNGLSITTAGLLIDGPNAVRPKATILPEVSRKKSNCYFCGELSSSLEDARQTIFPFITGSSGLLNFNTMGGSPEKACWKCAFAAKFVPVNGFYLSANASLFAFLPYSLSFEKMLDSYRPLHEAEYVDSNLYKNFEHPLGDFFQKPFEVMFAFLFTLYRKVLHQSAVDSDDLILRWEEWYEFVMPLEFIVLYAEPKGKTFIGKTVWSFRDSVYFFRLMEALETSGVSIKAVMRLLLDSTQKKEKNREAKNRTLARNRICERMLKKQSILDLIEKHVFSSDQTYIKPLADLVQVYEPIIRTGDSEMTIEEQNAAVILGKRVGMTVGNEGKKGDLFALRKARKKGDFLSELNRLQFKYHLAIPPDVYEGKLTDSNFVEFKQFCLIAALNSFHAANQPERRS